MPYEEAKRAWSGKRECHYYADALEQSRQFRQSYRKRKPLIKAEEMPWETSPQGRIKHIVNEKMNTPECCLDLYQQVLPPGGCSGKHRHMSEELFYVLEGKGYDLHWDVQFDCDEKYVWSWKEQPQKYEWEEGDWVYIPSYTMHQHFNADSEKPARFITATSRIVKAMGFDWLEQVEDAPEYKVQGRRARKLG